MTRYLIIIEPTNTGYSAYSPDLPGCASTGASRGDVEVNMREAISGHLAELRADGSPIPEPTSTASYVEVAA